MSIPTTEISSFSSEDLFVQEESSQEYNIQEEACTVIYLKNAGAMIWRKLQGIQ